MSSRTVGIFAGARLWALALALILALVPALLGLSANAASGKSIEVPTREIRSIGAALAIAKPGDTIRIAPGVYYEQLQIGVSGLSIEGGLDKDKQPLVILRPPTGKASAPLIRDSRDTRWSGVALEGKGGTLLELRDFSGTFRHCRFDLTPMSSFARIYGGSPEFFGCTFLGAPQTVSTVEVYGGKEAPGKVSFAYTLFQDFGGGALVLKGNQNVTATNCLFAACGHFYIREKGVQSSVSALNSVFYLIASSQLVRQEAEAPKAVLDTCLYTPAPTAIFRWLSRPLDVQKELDCRGCITASPRFKGGRQVFLNLCIDDSRNLLHWSELCEKLNRLSLPMSVALNTDSMPKEGWKIVAERVNQGHEAASHTLTHSSLLAKGVMRLGYPGKAESAEVSVSRDKLFTLDVDGKTTLSINLAEDRGLTFGGLVRTLEGHGLRAELLTVSIRDVPAVFLAETWRQDILFPDYAVEFVLDSDAYLRHILTKSRSDVESKLKALGVANWQCRAAVCPYAEYTDTLNGIVQEAGYVLARGNNKSHEGNYFERVSVLPLQDLSSETLILYPPLDEREELYRVLLDHLKYRGGAIGFYSHGANEMTISEWETLFDVLRQQPMIKIMRFTDIADELKKNCTALEPGVYACERGKYPNVGEVGFVPEDDSPLRGAGKPTPYKVNFSGQALPEGVAPNIGLY
jgi:hypothetical protein